MNPPPAATTPEFKRVTKFDVPFEDWCAWKWAMSRRGGGWVDFFRAGMKLLVREVVKLENDRRKSVPPGIAQWLDAEDPRPFETGQKFNR
jgi:hypothetical protein